MLTYVLERVGGCVHATGREQRGGAVCGHIYSRMRTHVVVCVPSISAYWDASRGLRQHTLAYVSIRQHTSAYVSIRQHTSAEVSIRQHTSAYVSIRQHPAY